MHLFPGRAEGHFNVLRGVTGESRRRQGGRRLRRQPPAVACRPELALLLLMDPATGVPAAIVDATAITEMRTGAVTAIGAEHLARADARIARSHRRARHLLLERPPALPRAPGAGGDPRPLAAAREPRVVRAAAERRARARRARGRQLGGVRPRRRRGRRGVPPEPARSRCWPTEWIEPGALVIPYGTVSAVELDADSTSWTRSSSTTGARRTPGRSERCARTSTPAGCRRPTCTPSSARSCAATRPGAGEPRRDDPALAPRPVDHRHRARRGAAGQGPAARRGDAASLSLAACGSVRPQMGVDLSEGMRCRGWQQEAALRMLHNNLHPDVAERPAGAGRLRRDRQGGAQLVRYHTIERELQRLGDDETLLVQSGKPVAVFETQPDAPRVLIANSNLVPQWATWEKFRELDAAGLMMYGQMTAGSWIYIGSQGILQGTYETFAAAARKRFDGTLEGRLVVTAGLGGMGGAQPLAITMLGGAALCVEVDLQRIERRIETGYLDERAADLDDALRAAGRGPRASDGGCRSAWPATPPRCCPSSLARGVEIDVVTDQTSAHDPLNGYIPAGLTVEQAEALRALGPRRVPAPGGGERGGPRRRDPRAAAGRRRGVRLRQRAARPGRPSTATPRRSPIRASCRPTSGRCSARARARFDGWRCPATRPTSMPPTRRSSTCSATRSTSPAGSRWPASGFTSRVCRRASAGWATASATAPGCASTRWSPAASCRGRS